MPLEPPHAPTDYFLLSSSKGLQYLQRQPCQPREIERGETLTEQQKRLSHCRRRKTMINSSLWHHKETFYPVSKNNYFKITIKLVVYYDLDLY